MIKDNVDFSYREDDVEIRFTESLDGTRYPEIVKWEGAVCYTLALWVADRHWNWTLNILDDRFFDVFPKGIPSGMWQAIQTMSKLANAKSLEEE